MTKVKDIQYPLRKTHKLDGTDQQILDVMFDMKIPHMNEMLTKLHAGNVPMLAVVKLAPLHNTIMVLMFLPPDIWLDFDHQKYQMYLAPDLHMMIHHFIDWKMRSRDSFEIAALTKVIEYLESHLMNQRVSHTW